MSLSAADTNPDIAPYAAQVRAQIRAAESDMITSVSTALAAIVTARQSVNAWRDHEYRHPSETDDIARLLLDATELTVEAAHRTIQRFAY
ncbi:Uncharacterised protein [Mycobacteroides abscessus subsp. abscessus]|uniref:hypothetical protein n=1 Tax=Mycobacteroides abscessus TaxID=36809 RepID=UPI00092A2994|nr:hypothetical protein [Mycobacteroides abscessus]SHY45795.1 Uncharacterised protein [Mycobacteroides abscessus subsp. abscessus]